MNLNFKDFSDLNAYEIYEILRARAEIFVSEQKITCPDPDGIDYDAYHCFMTEDGRVIACLRAFSIGGDTVKIGRVVTLTHGKGHGGLLMRESIPKIIERFGCKRLVISAQTQAEGFYKKAGFITVSEEYMEDGIPHVKMEMRSSAENGLSQTKI